MYQDGEFDAFIERMKKAVTEEQSARADAATRRR
jgi:hypothetical protein